jgi:hypothetical protein
MHINKLKKVLIEKIAGEENEDVLQVIYRMLDHIREPYVLNDEERNAIHEAQAEYSRGEVVSDEDLQKELDKWLKD